MMDLARAWWTLGQDPKALIESMAKLPTRRERLEAAEKALDRAKKLAKEVSSRNHPDKHPGDPGASAKFREVQEALQSIIHHTAVLREKNAELDRKIAEGRDGFIERK